MSEAGYLCLTTCPPDLCWFCGELVHVIERGGFDGPNGNRYCSPECVEATEEAISRRPISDYCESCGFDRHEHADDCPKS